MQLRERVRRAAVTGALVAGLGLGLSLLDGGPGSAGAAALAVCAGVVCGALAFTVQTMVDRTLGRIGSGPPELRADLDRDTARATRFIVGVPGSNVALQLAHTGGASAGFMGAQVSRAILGFVLVQAAGFAWLLFVHARRTRPEAP